MTGASTRLAIKTPLWDSLLAANAYLHKAALVQFALLPPPYRRLVGLWKSAMMTQHGPRGFRPAQSRRPSPDI